MYFLALDLTWTPPTTLAPYSYTEAWKACGFFSSVTPQTRKSLLFNYFTSTSRTAGLGLAESQVKKIIKRTTKNPNTVTTNIQWIGNFFKFTLDLSHTKFPAKGQSFRLQQSYHFQQLQQNQILGNVSLSPSSSEESLAPNGLGYSFEAANTPSRYYSGCWSIPFRQEHSYFQQSWSSGRLNRTLHQ